MIAHIVALADPATMAPEARRRAIAQILATGYLRATRAHTARHVASPASPSAALSRAVGRNPLAEVTENEPSCVPVVNAPRTSARGHRGELR